MATTILDETGFNVQLFKSDVQPYKSHWELVKHVPRLQQKGIARINCVDCLDRTNLGMLAIGQEALKRQLILLGCIVSSNNERKHCVEEIGEIWEPPLPTEILRELSHLWGSVGDELAVAYAGSPAMHRADIIPDIVSDKKFQFSCCIGEEVTRGDQDKEIILIKGKVVEPTMNESARRLEELSGSTHLHQESREPILSGPLKGMFKMFPSAPAAPSEPDPRLDEPLLHISVQCNNQYSLLTDTCAFIDFNLLREIQKTSDGAIDVDRECNWRAKKRSNVSIAVQRYIHNVFGDLDRQRALDILLGKFRPRQGAPSIWEVELFPSEEPSAIRNQVRHKSELR